MTCTVSGVIGLPDGAAFAGAVLRLTPSPIRTVRDGSTVTVPSPITAVADADGMVSFAAVPGTYQVLETTQSIKFRLLVPDTSTADIADCIV